MRDAQHYDRPNEFMPFRFAAKHRLEGKDADDDDSAAFEQKFTDLKPHFYLWGAAKNPWYVVLLLVLLIFLSLALILKSCFCQTI